MNTDSSSVSPLEVFRILRSASGALFDQAVLHGQLARVEWAQEKQRLLKMLACTLLGYTCLLCALLFAGALVLAIFWGTAYRIPVAIALTCVYALGTVLALLRFRALAALGGHSFAATRTELAADIALLRTKL